MNGDRHIPASVRPDGSTRKEIKIRPGYKPPEDVEVYKNRTAEAWKTRAGSGIPGSIIVEQDEGKAVNSKNAKRREARRRAKTAEDGTQNGIDGEAESQIEGGIVEESPIAAVKASPTKDDWKSEPNNSEPTVHSEMEREKQARNLKKKLRQARELREKKDQGESLLPEQFAKVIKINELVRQLDSLGFDAKGERKEG